MQLPYRKIETVRTITMGIQMVEALTGEITLIEDNIPMNKKYKLATLVYCNSIDSIFRTLWLLIKKSYQ